MKFKPEVIKKMVEDGFGIILKADQFGNFEYDSESDLFAISVYF